MEFLIPIAVIPQMDEIYGNFQEVADNESGYVDDSFSGDQYNGTYNF